MGALVWVVVAVGGVVLLGVLLFLLQRWRRDSNYQRARRAFHLKREHLEAKFFEMVSGSGMPRGLEWTSCEFEDEVTYARDPQSGDLVAFVAITVSFAAIEGGGMEDVEAVGNLRAATAVFYHRSGEWQTVGRAIFNLNPAEAICQSSLKIVARDESTRIY